MSLIKVSYCVAYDWELLRTSIPRIYKEADVICISYDKNLLSWSGNTFTWDEKLFQQMIEELDPAKKIVIYKDTFYNPQLQPMQNEVAQRNKIAAFLGLDGWHIQLDTDEFFLNFDKFVAYLKEFQSGRKVNICCPMINLYKQIPEGILWIKPSAFNEIEYFPIATQYPSYEYGRRNGNFNVLTNFPILHQSWARQEQEIWEKLNNWGHAKDFDVAKYFNFWKEANAENYTSYKNFHHLHPHTWPALALEPVHLNQLSGSAITDSSFPMPITTWSLLIANSIWVSRAKKIWKSIAK